jgi:anti-sigma regulatory factor (Ser/Thr protein kinase)
VFEHEALLYSGPEEFLAGTAAFLREGVRAGEPTLVVVDAAKIAMLRQELRADAERVEFADMADIGANPARIIPAWRQFVDRHGNVPVRGIGEPIWPERTPAELAECRRHEALLNVAFEDDLAFRLLCPYDVGRLDPEVVHGAHCSHPIIAADGVRESSAAYPGVEAHAQPFTDSLPEPARTPRELPFDRGTVRLVRRFVGVHAIDAGVSGARVEDLVLAVDELATNSVRHGGGRGLLRVWEDDAVLLCEVRDGGLIEDPLVGRVKPSGDRVGGYGMWLVHQLCDLVQVRSSPAGTVVRIHTRVS